MAKVLISPDFGAGWSTWACSQYQRDFLFDAELIKDVEAGDRAGGVERFEARMRAKYGDDWSEYLGGGCSLEVVEVDGPFRVDEYDGSESLVLAVNEQWITP